MKNKLKDLLLFFSAFLPMYFLILIRLAIDIFLGDKSLNVLNSINIVTLLFLIVGGIVGIIVNVFKSRDKTKEITILSIENITDKHFLGYFSLFVLFALQFDLTYVSGYCTYVVIIILIGIVYIKNSLFYINPLLNILGYSFYDITYVEKNSDQQLNSRIFCRKKLKINGNYKIKIKNENFSFLTKK